MSGRVERSAGARNGEHRAGVPRASSAPMTLGMDWGSIISSVK